MFDDSANTVNGYTMGGLGIAIGTSLVFEEWRAKPAVLKDYKDVTQFRVNIHTLVRNINEALEHERQNLDTIVGYFKDEVEQVKTAINEAFPLAEVMFYVTEIKYYRRVIPRCVMKVSRSSRMQDIARLEADAVSACYDYLKELEDYNVERIERKSGHASKIAIALTHLPADLLCHHYYLKLYLAESHTGNIRDLSTFVHKILPKTRREYAQFIPFNQLSFYAYGDGGKMLSPAPPKVTKRYTELAVKARWRTNTTTDMIVKDINVQRDDALLDWFAR